MLQKLKSRARQLKTDIPALALALRHPDTPVIAKLLAALTVCYALSPVDLIPDFIPVLGYLDDLLLLPGLIALTVRCIPSEILSQCRAESASRRLSSRWYYALPIVLLWSALLILLIRLVLHGLL